MLYRLSYIQFKHTLPIGLPRLRNLINVYMSSNNRNDSVYTELPDLIFSLCRSVKSLIFLLEKRVYPVRIFEIVWLGVVIEVISSNWKVIATCADWYITDIFLSCKCVINELTRTRHNCRSSRTHRYTR